MIHLSSSQSSHSSSREVFLQVSAQIVARSKSVAWGVIKLFEIKKSENLIFCNFKKFKVNFSCQDGQLENFSCFALKQHNVGVLAVLLSKKSI